MESSIDILSKEIFFMCPSKYQAFDIMKKSISVAP
jgi:hypothetical protein